MIDALSTFDAWLFYFLHWGQLAITGVVVTNAVRAIWEEYGC